jgi:hypothetical protein
MDNNKNLLISEYDQAEENGRSAFSRENFHGSVKAWTDAARVASLLNRQDLVARSYRHIGFAFHGMGELEKADEARKLAFDAEGKISSPYKRKKSPPTTINNDIATNLGGGVMYDLDLKESSIAASSSSIARQTIIDQNASNDAVDYSNFVNVQHKIGSLESVRRQQRQKNKPIKCIKFRFRCKFKVV